MNEELTNYKKYVNFNCKTIADVGANEGVMTQFFLDQSKETQILCIEPHKINIDLLNNKFKNNNRVNVINGAISKTNGYCQIGLEQQQRTNGIKQAHVLSDNSIDLQKRNWNEKHKTQCWKLDDLCQDCEIIKMDIEGYEHEILYNSLKHLKNNKVFLLEIHSWEDLDLHGWNKDIFIPYNDSLNKMIKLFIQHGYTKFIPAKTNNLLKTNIDSNILWKDISLSQYKKDNKIVYYKVLNVIIMK